jgi:hypothetical protein
MRMKGLVTKKMLKQQAITYKQKAILILDDEQSMCFTDINLAWVLKILAKGPLTITDIQEGLKKHEKYKSEKTLYRYLGKLLKMGLIAKAGKRITSVDEGILITETIYARVAKVFISKKPKKFEDGEIRHEFEVAKILLSCIFDKKRGCGVCFTEIANRFDIEKHSLFVELLEHADPEALEQFAELDWKGINTVKEFVGWIALCLKYDVQDVIKGCYNDTSM